MERVSKQERHVWLRFVFSTFVLERFFAIFHFKRIFKCESWKFASTSSKESSALLFFFPWRLKAIYETESSFSLRKFRSNHMELIRIFPFKQPSFIIYGFSTHGERNFHAVIHSNPRALFISFSSSRALNGYVAFISQIHIATPIGLKRWCETELMLKDSWFTFVSVHHWNELAHHPLGLYQLEFD